MKRLLHLFSILLILTWTPYQLNAQIFTTPERLSLLLDQSVYKVTTADLNGDSLLDVMVSGPAPDVYWFENLGDNEFGFEQEIYEGSVFGKSSQAIDMDNDGDLDVISAESFANEIVWIENDGNGNFGTATPIFDGLLPIDDLILVDLDHDNKQDILFSVYTSLDPRSGRIYWSKNFGSGHFSGYSTIDDSIWGVKKLAVADLNGDGLNDVIGASFWDFRFNWYKNLGNGGFSSAHIIRPQQDTSWNDFASVADIDGDGDIDIINGDNKAPLLSWLENDGSGSFPQEHVISANNYSWDADAADFDLDGDMDIFTGLGNNKEVALILNNGDGTFMDPVIIANNIRVINDVHLADIDGDWDTDVFITSTLDHDVWFFENHRFDCAPVEVSIDTTICDSETIVVGPLEIDHAGTFRYSSMATAGCDSIFILHVTQYPKYQTVVYDTIDTGMIYTLPDGEQVSNSGSYTSTIFSASGCDSTIFVHLWVNPMVATQETTLISDWSISPNPVYDQITISIPYALIHHSICYIINSTGEIVKEIVIENGDTTLPFDLPSGVYFACLKSALYQPVIKLTVVKVN